MGLILICQILGEDNWPELETHLKNIAVKHNLTEDNFWGHGSDPSYESSLPLKEDMMAMLISNLKHGFKNIDVKSITNWYSIEKIAEIIRTESCKQLEFEGRTDYLYAIRVTLIGVIARHSGRKAHRNDLIQIVI